MANQQIPVTILTGYLGSGKTTLLKRILQDDHKHKIAVIENEFGEIGIDNELLFEDQKEQIIEMNNGCICCTVRGDLIRILGTLSTKRKLGEINFSHVVIETTGLADPAPVAQTFFVDDSVAENYQLDAIVTTVDARHAQQQLDEHHEAQEQIGFADRILITKEDLVNAKDMIYLRKRLVNMNPRAKILRSKFGDAPVSEILDIKGFRLDAILDIEPDFLSDVEHEHDDDISSFVYENVNPFDIRKVQDFLGGIIEIYGPRLLRYKGIFYIKGMPNRVILQGVHMLIGTETGPIWKANEKKLSKMVFIGKELPRTLISNGLDACVAKSIKY